MARTSLRWLAVCYGLWILGCSEPEAAVIFESQFVTVGGHRLEMGRPVEEWEAVLGRGESDLESVSWPKYRFAVFVAHNACRKPLVTGGMVNLSSDPEVTVLAPLGTSVRLEHCLLREDTKLSGAGLNCGTFWDFGGKVLVRGMPFDFAYQDPDGEFSRMVMIQNSLPSRVSQSLGAPVLEELGLYLGNGPKRDAWLAEHPCDQPLPRLVFGWPRFRRSLGRLWRSFVDADGERKRTPDSH